MEPVEGRGGGPPRPSNGKKRAATEKTAADGRKIGNLGFDACVDLRCRRVGLALEGNSELAHSFGSGCGNYAALGSCRPPWSALRAGRDGICSGSVAAARIPARPGRGRLE